MTRALHERAPDMSPRELSRRARLTLNAREIRSTLAALRSLGSEAEYESGPFDDPACADEAARRVMARFGPVRGLVHGAGVILDHPVKGKCPEDFAKVYATKAVMAQSLLAAFQAEPLKLILFMSSSTARFGRKAQADYAAANEVLNKLAWEERRSRPGAAVLSPSFGPFRGGMVDGRLAALFASEGVGLIDPAAGARAVVRVLGLGPAGPCEMVVLGPGTDPALLDAAAGQGPADGEPCPAPPAAAAPDGEPGPAAPGTGPQDDEPHPAPSAAAAPDGEPGHAAAGAALPDGEPSPAPPGAGDGPGPPSPVAAAPGGKEPQ
jgi:hypothetical protein